MLPFVFLDESKLGPFHPFGICCALGFFAWDAVFLKRGVSLGFERRELRALTIWLLVLGIFTAWLVDTIFYHPGAVPTLTSITGLSSTGGFFGALLGTAAWLYVRVRRTGFSLEIKRREAPFALMPASELIVSTWPIAFALGRLGCALIHDHPGITVAPGTLSSLIAVAWPRDAHDGVHHVLGPLHVVWGSETRFDLGLCECLFLTCLATAFALTYKRKTRPWTYTAAACLAYAPVRFSLDFLRLQDVAQGGDSRHLGLTFAQWWSVAVLALGFYLVRKALRSPVLENSPFRGISLPKSPPEG